MPKLDPRIKAIAEIRDSKIKRTLERYGINIEKENAND